MEEYVETDDLGLATISIGNHDDAAALGKLFRFSHRTYISGE